MRDLTKIPNPQSAVSNNKYMNSKIASALCNKKEIMLINHLLLTTVDNHHQKAYQSKNDIITTHTQKKHLCSMFLYKYKIKWDPENKDQIVRNPIKQNHQKPLIVNVSLTCHTTARFWYLTVAALARISHLWTLIAILKLPTIGVG